MESCDGQDIRIYQQQSMALLITTSFLSPSPEFAFYEQIFVGALDHGDFELARRHLALLAAQFPESSRVQRLEGMLAESRGR